MTSDTFGDIQREATFALGLFVNAWSTVEGTLDVAISKQLGLNPFDGSIITAGLQFRAKSDTLKGLLMRNPDENVDALEVLAKIKNMPDRNDLLHGIAGASEHGLVFRRRTNYGEFKSTDKYFSTERLLRLSVEVTGLVTTLQSHLGITEKDYLCFFEESHTATTKP